jgi:hypothetical protein
VQGGVFAVLFIAELAWRKGPLLDQDRAIAIMAEEESNYRRFP